MKILTPLFAAIVATAFLMAVPATVQAETIEVQMLNKHPDNKKLRNVFLPAVVKAKPGDTIRFISVDKGHNSESLDGMMPEGAEPWKSKISKDFEVTVETPGVYGYRCTPHVTLGMVGLIVVEGEGWDANLEAAKAVKHRGKAKKVFEQLWAEVDELMAAPAE